MLSPSKIIENMVIALGLDSVSALAEKLDITPEAVSMWKGRAVPPAKIMAVAKLSGRSVEWITGQLIDVHYLAGAGSPQVDSGEIVISVTLPEDFTKDGIVPVMVSGDSMVPVFLNRAIVGVDTKNRSYISGKYYAVWVPDQGALIKKLSTEPGKVFVESLNKSEHSFYVGMEEIHDHFILGRVVWWINQEEL
jgi:SOS-response transcriptional repressor LexA